VCVKDSVLNSEDGQSNPGLIGHVENLHAHACLDFIELVRQTPLIIVLKNMHGFMYSYVLDIYGSELRYIHV
jgi:hypothetical protein